MKLINNHVTHLFIMLIISKNDLSAISLAVNNFLIYAVLIGLIPQ